ncbi:leukotriene A-4 hydrolase [Sarcoptes scabiei]|nr:leukotriene A-4 hydrolase [Sarcoptes scabiei]
MTTKTFIVRIEIHRVKKDGLVDENASKICFKRDGSRFDEEYTLKLPIETNYEFRLQIRPPMPVRSVSLRTDEGDESGIKIVDQSSSENGAMYSFQWDSSNHLPNKKRQRSKFHIIIVFQDNTRLDLPLQVKYYRLENTDHSMWGTPLSHINFECEQSPGLTSSTILAKLFR